MLLDIAQFARGANQHCIWAARLAADTANLGALGVLAADREPRVRGEAARGLAQHVADHGDGAATIAVLEGAIGDRGRCTGVQVAGVLAGNPHASALAPIQVSLATHPSATVRQLAACVADTEAETAS